MCILSLCISVYLCCKCKEKHIYIYIFFFVFFFYVLHHAEIRCPEPVLAEHGILSVTGNDRMYGRTLIRTGTVENSNTGATSYKIGALAKYRCERGYKVVGEPLSTCEENGKWSGEVPQCVCKYASDPVRPVGWNALQRARLSLTEEKVLFH